jgi:hypothetical protein
MILDRVALRLSQQDSNNLTTIIEALDAQRRQWDPSVTVTQCLRLALKLAADAMVKGDLGATKGRSGTAT